MTIYFIGAEGGRIKIGYTAAESAEARLATLQTGSPEKLRILTTCPGGQGRESELHAMFARERMLGEWFEGSVSLRSLVAHVQRVGTSAGWCDPVTKLPVVPRNVGNHNWQALLDAWEEAPETGVYHVMVSHAERPFEAWWCLTDRRRSPIVATSGLDTTAKQLALVDHDREKVVAVWIQAAFHQLLLDRGPGDRLGDRVPEISELNKLASEVHHLEFHHRVQQTLPMAMGLPKHCVLSAAEFIEHLSAFRDRTLRRYAVLSMYVEGYYRSLEGRAAA